jgi:penicillin-binding protein 1A
MAAKNNNRGTTADKDFKYYTRTFWKIFLLGMGSILLFSYLPFGAFFGTMPSFEDLETRF